MKKNIIAIILSLVLMTSMIVFAETNDTLLTEKEQKSIDFVTTFNLIMLDSNDNFNPDAKVTRGELAQIICSIFNLSMSNSSKWYEEVFKESNANITLDEANSNEQLFVDLKTTHDYYSYIETAYSMGILHGNDKNEFLPDSFVTYEQFNKVMVGLLGYTIKADANGGYPYGYNMVANELKLTSGIKYSGNKEMSRKDMAVEIFNAIDVEVMRITSVTDNGYSYETDNGEKFINTLGLKKVVGQLTANSDSTLYGSSTLLKNTVSIGNEVFNLSEKAYSLSDYIGREVEAYASNDKENTIETIFLYFLTGRDNALTINMNDFGKYESNTITYKENDKNKNVKIKTGAPLIRNRSLESTYDNSSFLFDCGTITLVSTANSNIYDLIIIDGYDSIYVSNVDYEDKILHDKFKGKTPAYNFKSFEEENIEVYKNGEKASFEDIKTDDILDVSAGNNSVRIYISNNTIANYTISEITQKDGITVYSNGTDLYSVTNDFVSYPDKKTDIIGSIGTLYLNKFNQIVWFSEGATDSRMYAYLIASKPSNDVFETGVDIQLYDLNSEEIQEFKLKSTVNFDAPDGKNLKKPSDEIYNTYLKNYTGVIRYKLNAQKEVDYIEMPINVSGVKGETGRLYDLFAINSWESKSYEYYKESIGNGLFYVDTTGTQILKIPSDANYLDDEFYYKKGNRSELLTNNQKYVPQAYTIDPDTIYANFLTIKSESAVVSRLRDYRYFAVVKDVCTVYKDDSIAKKFTLVTVPTQDMTTLKEIEVYDKEESTQNALGEKCMYSECAVNATPDKDGKMSEFTIVPGDIISYAIDEYNYFSSAPVVVYKSDMYNPHIAENERGKLGWLAGTEPTYKQYGNPLVEENGTFMSSIGFWNGEHRIALGYPIHYKNGVYKLTTQDLSNGSEFSPNGLGKYEVRDYLYPSWGCTITIKDGEVEVSKLSLENLRTYEYYGKDCSQVLNMLNYGGTKTMIIINRD